MVLSRNIFVLPSLLGRGRGSVGSQSMLTLMIRIRFKITGISVDFTTTLP